MIFRIVSLAVIIFLMSSCMSNTYKKVVVKDPVHHREINGENKLVKDYLTMAYVLKKAFPYGDSIYGTPAVQEQIRTTREKLTAQPDLRTFLFETQRLLALANCNHAYVMHPCVYCSSTIYPLYIEKQKDQGWTIFGADQAYPEELTGQSLVALNGVPVDSLYMKVRPYLGQESEASNIRFFSYQVLCGRPPVLEYFRVKHPDSMHVWITVRDSHSVEKQYRLQPVDVKQLKWRTPSLRYYKRAIVTDSGYVYRIYPEKQLMVMQLNQFMDRASWLRGIKEEVPAILRPAARGMLKKAYKGKRKGRLASVKPGTESMLAFYRDAFAAIQKNNIRHLVVDVRHNTGGNIYYVYQFLRFLQLPDSLKHIRRSVRYSDIYKELSGKIDHLGTPDGQMHDLEAARGDGEVYKRVCDPEDEYYVPLAGQPYTGKIYVLTGPSSVSSATLFPLLLKDNGLAVIVGEPPANNVTGPASFSSFRLPYTGTAISMSMSWFSRPDTGNNSRVLDPDIPIQYRVGEKDEAIDLIFELFPAP